MIDRPRIPPLVYVVRGLGILCTGLAIGGFMSLLILRVEFAVIGAAIFVIAAVVRWLAGRAR